MADGFDRAAGRVRQAVQRVPPAPPTDKLQRVDAALKSDAKRFVESLVTLPARAGAASQELREEGTINDPGVLTEMGASGLRLSKLPVSGRTSGFGPEAAPKPRDAVAEPLTNPEVPPAPVVKSPIEQLLSQPDVPPPPPGFEPVRAYKLGEPDLRGSTLVFDIVGPEGKTGNVRVKIDGDTATLDTISADRKGPNSLGPTAMRELLADFRSRYPNVKRIVADRTSGARSQGSEFFEGAPIEVALPPQRTSSLGAAATTPTAVGAAPLPPSYPQAVASVQARIGKAPKDPLVKDIVAEVVDDLNPVSRAERAAGANQATLDPTTSPYQALRLTRGSGGKVEQFLQNGTFSYDTLANKGPSFVEAVSPIRKIKDEFKAYLLANRDLELEARGIETGVDRAASQVVAQNAPQVIKDSAKKLYRYQDDVLQYAKDAGLLTDQAVADMRAANWAYIPFYRVMDEGRSAPFTSRGFQTGRPTSQIKGSERQVLDPLESVIRNTQTFVQKAEHNRALKVLEDFSNQHPQAGILKPVKTPVRPIEVQPGEITRIVDDLNIPPQVANLVGNETFTIFRRSDKELPPNVIQIFKDGKPKLYEVDPEIARAIKGMDNVDMGNFLRIVGAPSKWLRAGVVLDPTYMARNLIRDQFSAALQSQNNYYPLWDFAKGLGARVKGGDTYQNWLKAGGAQSALQALDRSSAAVKLASKYGQDPTLGGRVKNVITAPLDVLRVMSQVVDEATRLGEFKNATKGQTDPRSLQRGAFASRDVTTDFSKHGRDPTIRALSQISEFMNAQIQGTAREAQQVKRHPGRTAAITAASITLPSIYLWVQNHDDPRYRNAPSWEKDAYWMIMPADPEKEPWRIPKPWVFGMLGGSLVERSLDSFYDKKPEAFKGFATNLGKALLPNYIPTIAKPMIEQFSNKSLFTDRPIEPKRLENVPPSERFTETTPEVLKKVGKLTESSPLMLQNYIRAYGGTLAQNAVSLADTGYKALGLTDKAPAPTKSLADIPVIRAFVSRYPSANAQPIQDFYEKNQEIEQKVNARREARRRGDETTAKTYEEQVEMRTQGFKKQLDAGHREVRRILNDRDPAMTPDVKREAIKREYLQMITNAQKGLEAIRQEEARRQLRTQPAPEYKGP